MNRASVFQQAKTDNYFPSGNRGLQRKSDFGNRELVRSENGQRQLTDNNSNLKSGPKDAVENRTGLSDSLKGGLESLSGMDLSGVRVHRNSSEPARVNALAYTQGQDIHVGPGQEKHLPHEGWHVVQQMQGRVTPTMQVEGMSINEDKALEQEADAMGAKASFQGGGARQRSRREVGSIAQTNQRIRTLQPQKTVVQMVLPPALAGLGAWLTAKTTIDAAGVVAAISAIGATGYSVGNAVMAGSTGVQEVQLPNNWMSRRDKALLEQIVQYRLINSFVNQWNINYVVNEIRRGRQQTAPIVPSGPVSAVLNQTMLDAVKTQVKVQIETDLNANTKHQTSEHIFSWADSGDWSTTGVVDEWGTVGAVEFVDMAASELDEQLRLSFSARQIPGMVLSGEGERRVVKQLRGGRFRRHHGMKRGYSDELGINLAGGAPTSHEDLWGGHGQHVYDTAWSWDNNTTRWVFNMYVLPQGMPWVSAEHPVGEPAD